MEITSVKIHKVFDNSDRIILAIASILIDNMIAIHDIRLLKNEGKMFIAMPNKKLNDGTFKDLCHPISAEGRKLIENAVISAYVDYCNEAN